MTDRDDLQDAVTQAKRHPSAEQLYTRLQSDRAATGMAARQCSECGSFRADGAPPVLHEPGCSTGGSPAPAYQMRIVTRPQDWAEPARSILRDRGAWRTT